MANPQQIIGETPGRSGVSPIGTDSPNTGATAATNSSYARGAYASGVNFRDTDTSYTLQDTDYQGIVVFNTDSAASVTLNSGLSPRGSGNNFSCFIVNIKNGAITLTPSPTPALYPINGASSLNLPAGVGANVFFANRQWWAFSGATFVSVTEVNGVAVTDPNFCDSAPVAEVGYQNVKWQTSAGNVSAEIPIATTSNLGLTQPDGTSIGVAAGIIGTIGFSGTVDLAPLTTMGTPGTLTVVNGLITAYTPPT